MNNDKSSLRFSNEEIIEYLIKPLRNYPELDIYFDFEDDSILQDKKMIEVPSSAKIEHISFEGYDGDFSLHFFSRHIGLYTPAENEEIIFIDESLTLGYDEAYDNIIYEGPLHDKSPEEILTLILEFVIVLIGATNIEVEAKIDEEKKHLAGRVSGYSPLEFVVRLSNDSKEKREVRFDNITFVIN